MIYGTWSVNAKKYTTPFYRSSEIGVRHFFAYTPHVPYIIGKPLWKRCEIGSQNILGALCCQLMGDQTFPKSYDAHHKQASGPQRGQSLYTYFVQLNFGLVCILMYTLSKSIHKNQVNKIGVILF